MKQNITLIQIFNNDEKLYAGKDLWHYAKKLFFAKNVKLGYHNFRHMMHMTYQVYDAIKYMKINPVAARYLLIAAMFHDYGHSGNRNKSDDFNIRKAVRGVKRHIDKTNPTDKKNLKEIIRLIQATEWFGEAGHNLFERDMFIDILRDADSCQTLDTSWMQQVIFGLGTELGKSPREMLEAQLPFLQERIKFYSPWGKAKFEPILKQRIEEVKVWKEKVLTF